MSQSVDELLQDAGVRLATARKYAKELGTAGISAEYLLTQFEGQIGTLRTENTAYGEAKNRQSELSESQGVQVLASQDVIRKLRAAAQSAFYGDKITQKEFGIGKDVPATVKALSTELPLLKEVAGRYGFFTLSSSTCRLRLFKW